MDSVERIYISSRGWTNGVSLLQAEGLDNVMKLLQPRSREIYGAALTKHCLTRIMIIGWCTSQVLPYIDLFTES